MELKICRDTAAPFTMTPNAILETEPGLSWKAKGLYAYLVGRPENWHVQMADLVNRSTDGEAAVKSALRELEDAAWITRRQIRTKNGQMGPVLVTVHITKATRKNQLKPAGDFPPAVKPLAGDPLAGNRPLNNTDLNKTDLTKTDVNNIQESTLPRASRSVGEFPSNQNAQNGLYGPDAENGHKNPTEPVNVKPRPATAAEPPVEPDCDQAEMMFPAEAGTFEGFCQAFPRMWNRMALETGAVPIAFRKGQPPMLSPSRLKRVKAIWGGEELFRENWKKALSALYQMPDFCGGNKTGYRINVDQFIDPDGFLRVWERASTQVPAQEHEREIGEDWKI